MARYEGVFGERVKAILGEKRLSPYDVARLSNGEISHQTVRNMAQGILPHPNLIVQFALAVGEDPNELLGLTGWRLHYTGQETAASVNRRHTTGAGSAVAVAA